MTPGEKMLWGSVIFVVFAIATHNLFTGKTTLVDIRSDAWWGGATREQSTWIAILSPILLPVFALSGILLAVDGCSEMAGGKSFMDPGSTKRRIPRRAGHQREDSRRVRCNLWVRRGGRSVVWRKTSPGEVLRVVFRGESSTKVRDATGRAAWIPT